jgi:hypothetical protein
MKILEFVNGYKEITTDKTKENYFKKNVNIKTYLPILNKITIAERIADVVCFEHEKYITESGKEKSRSTMNVQVNTPVQYLLTCRAIVENYTDLEIEDTSFYKEFDLLQENGIMDKILCTIPNDELKNFEAIVNMKREDILYNHGTVKGFISDKVERIAMISSTVLKPAMEKIATELQNMDDDKIMKLSDRFSKVMEKVMKKTK